MDFDSLEELRKQCHQAPQKRFSVGLRGDASRLLKRDVALGEPYIQGEPVYERINLKTGSGHGFSSELPMFMAESFGVFARSHGSAAWCRPNG